MSLHLERIELSMSFRSAAGSSSMTRRMPVRYRRWQALRSRSSQPSTRVGLSLTKKRNDRGTRPFHQVVKGASPIRARQ
jgi:hypothetical protein